MDGFKLYVKQYKWPLAACCLAALLVIGLVIFLIQNSVTNDGNKKQEDLIVYYNDTENVLSDCLVKTKQSIGATEAQTDALDRVITDAVRGRYTEGSTAVPGEGNPLFSAIVEQYPDTAGLSKSFQDVLVVINGCRSDFRDSQAKLQANIAAFNKWRTGSLTVRTFGGEYPTNALEINFEDGTLSGKAALAQMRKLVVVSEARSGRDSNVIENEDPFADPASTGTTTQ